MSSDQVLIVGATGTVGSEVLRACLARDANVRALVRSPAKAAALPAGVDTVQGDLTSDDDVRAALEGCDAAFYVSPHIEEEVACAARFTEACRERGARLVFVGSHIDGGSRFSRWLLRRVVGVLMAPYRTKFRLSEAVRSAGIDAVVFSPTNFCQNDELRVVRESLRAGGPYLYPVGTKGMNRIDVRDIGEVCARALLTRDIDAGGYSLAGPESLSGAECAALWGEALGRDVEYREDAAAWERGLAEELAGKKLDDVVQTWRSLARFGIPTMPKAVATTTRLLGRPPTTYRDYVQRTAASWRSAA